MDTVTSLSLDLLSGFGNEFATEAVPGALPIGKNSPQRPPLGLYAEQFTATSFTVPRREARRSWLYRIRPSADHPPYRRIDGGLLCGRLLCGGPKGKPYRENLCEPAVYDSAFTPNLGATPFVAGLLRFVKAFGI